METLADRIFRAVHLGEAHIGAVVAGFGFKETVVEISQFSILETLA